MKEQDRKEYLEKYKKAKEHGVPFFPDIIFKDVIVSLLILIVLVLLAYFVGAPVEARANPNDTNYTPRPEWYFLFLFQMLKYFPGKFEVVGAMILPTLFIGLLLLLPFLDKSPTRHFLKRPYASIAAVLVVFGIGLLTFLALNEAAPPQAVVIVDKAADLYAKDCANCHGPSISVPAGADLHQIIAAGNHQGMPAWGGDLSTDEIDMLVGFVLSPNGSSVYTRDCAGCHKNPLQALGNPVELQRVIDEGKAYPAHQDQKDVPNWKETMTADEQNALLNFLAAPDGQRLFVVNCSGCHGAGIAFTGTKEELRELIVKGGHALTMPAWQNTLSTEDLNTLAAYVIDPKNTPAGAKLFGQFCSTCHGEAVPTAPDKSSALTMIASGGAHVTMPVWGDILTSDQIDALVTYTMESGSGTGIASGAKLFADNCMGCHGKYGQGGPNPTRAGDIIAPISAAEYLKTRDDSTITNIITQGQPDFGMSPFGATYGGSLSDEQIGALVAFIRNWETTPPVATAPTTPASPAVPVTLKPKQIYDGICAQCHGTNFEGTPSGPALEATALQGKYDFDTLFNILNDGVLKVAMPGVGHMFTEDQVKQLVNLIADMTANTSTTGTTSPGGGEVSFANNVLPILQSRCTMCHGSSSGFGGFDSSTYQGVMTSGNEGPYVIAGDAAKSKIVELLNATSGFMPPPPTGPLPDTEIQTIMEWINAGAKDN
jgi:mono/diheme cytochrome c family protein